MASDTERLDSPPGNPLGSTLRVGTVVACRLNDGARKPAYVLDVDLGPHGRRTSSAQLTEAYRPEDLVGRRVVVATSLGSRLIAGVRSEVLVLGAAGDDGVVKTLTIDRDVPDGSLVH